jgi:Holliday junction resolvase
MANANYKAGYRAELKAVERLKSLGFITVRSAKSGGPFDIIGFSETDIVCVQIKLVQKGHVAAFNELKKSLSEIKTPPNCKKELWVWERRGGFHYFPINGAAT